MKRMTLNTAKYLAMATMVIFLFSGVAQADDGERIDSRLDRKSS